VEDEDELGEGEGKEAEGESDEYKKTGAERCPLQARRLADFQASRPHKLHGRIGEHYSWPVSPLLKYLEKGSERFATFARRDTKANLSDYANHLRGVILQAATAEQ
jgi:hypothetical protein